MSKMVTRLYVIGKNGLSIENFPTDKYHTFGKKYIECYDYFTKNKNYFYEENVSIEELKMMGYVIESIFEDDKCEDFAELYSNAIKYLLDHCNPKEDDIESDKHVLDKSEIKDDKDMLADFLFVLDERIKALEKFVKEYQKEKFDLKSYSQMVIDEISKGMQRYGRR